LAPSALRTVLATAGTNVYGTVFAAGAPAWPAAETDDNLDYSLDMTPLLNNGTDAIASTALSSAPSGTGELQITALSFVGALITAQLAGGVGGRNYIVKFAVLTTHGNTFDVPVRLTINRALNVPPVYPLAAPPSLGFSTPLVVNASGTGTGGPTGSSGTVAEQTFVFTQSTAAAVWVITHNLGVCPAIVVIDSASNVIEGDIHYNDLNTVTLTFSGAFAGIAYLN
jgi:hypothetical protein